MKIFMSQGCDEKNWCSNEKIRDDEYFNFLTYDDFEQVLKVEDEPEEILSNVDPMIIASMKARLRGETISESYDISERTIDEIRLMIQKKKLLQIFFNESQIYESFSSVENIKNIQKQITRAEVDKKILSDYASICSEDKNIDEMDFYRFFLFDAPLVNKDQRLEKMNYRGIFDDLLEGYQLSHFDVVTLSVEYIQMSRTLSKLFRERKLLGLFNNFLSMFYGQGI